MQVKINKNALKRDYIYNIENVRPTWVYLLDFFCPRLQFYVLLSPYLCRFFFLYLDLYVLGDDA